MLDKTEDFFILIICLLATLIGGYCLYDNYLTYSHANDTSLLKYKPGYGAEEEVKKKIKGNMVAWLTVNDTSIDFPVMQGDTNTEYLNKDPYGEYSLSGSIFLDFRNKPDFTDEYSLIYGHHMEGDVMFGGLDKYLEEGYLKQHQIGEMIVGDRTYKLNLFAVAETEATNDAVFAPTETDVKKTWDYIKTHALYWDETGADRNKPVVALSTCKYPDTAERTIVFGTLS